ncbi:MAG: glycosyltransferase [Chloroflexaceae bacterium]|jgi:hypothetical protein|nr:glycosyltransferase [Chloroflexaceae bacterium]
MKRPTRIAFISEHASPVAVLGSTDAGGQNVYVDAVSRQLARRGYLVDIFTRREDASAAEVVNWAPGVRVINLVAGPAAPLPKDELWPWMPVFRRNFLQFMVRDGARYDLLHAHFWMSGWVTLGLRRLLNIPAVQLFHALGATKRRHQGSADTSPPERMAVEREIVREMDRIIAQCPAERRELQDDYAADPNSITVVPGGTNCDMFQPVPHAEARQRIGLQGNEFTIVYVGRMLPRKDVRNVVRALAILSHQSDLPMRMLVVGGESADPDPATTPEIGVLRQLAAELGVADRVLFYGKRQPEVLRYFYGAGDVAVTTPWYEPFGLTPLEAMACGRPVVGSAVGGLSHTIHDGVTGLLVPPRSPERLAASLHYLLTHPEQRIAMGYAARARVEREFTWPTVAQRTATLYESLLAERRQRLETGLLTRELGGD